MGPRHQTTFWTRSTTLIQRYGHPHLEGVPFTALRITSDILAHWPSIRVAVLGGSIAGQSRPSTWTNSKLFYLSSTCLPQQFSAISHPWVAVRVLPHY